MTEFSLNVSIQVWDFIASHRWGVVWYSHVLHYNIIKAYHFAPDLAGLTTMAPSSLEIQAGSLETCRLSAYYSDHLIRPTMHSWRPAIFPGLMPVGHFLSESAVISGVWMTATHSRNHFTSSFPSDCHHHSADGGIFHRDAAWHSKARDTKLRAIGNGHWSAWPG